MSTTICAQATPPGKGGISVIRLSGPQALTIGQALSQHPGTPRYAHYGTFNEPSGDLIDRGISLYFEAPNSFTGEDVFELQGHGGPVVMDKLLRTCVQLGAVLAKPGEFSERAFVNDKLDLAQAESIADLINASSEQAAKNAVRSLEGQFGLHIDTLIEQLIQLRLYVEAALDFPEEEINFLADGQVSQQLQNLQSQLNLVLQQTRQGMLVQEGIQLVIAGAPNMGKSSLLNALAGQERAIVSSVPGTTRDTLKETIHLDGLPVHIVDTAGLRESNDTVEKIGIQRTQKAVTEADLIMLVHDCRQPISAQALWQKLMPDIPIPSPLLLVMNKIDLLDQDTDTALLDPTLNTDEVPCCYISVKQTMGLDTLIQTIQSLVNYRTTLEGQFSARRRHLDALEQAQSLLNSSLVNLTYHAAGELLAEDLRLAQNYLGEITGQFTQDDLLGRIFGSFCIGK